MEQREELKELLKLMQENPDLPIIPMVNYDVVADDDYCYWMGSWGGCKVDKFWVGAEAIHFYEEEDWEGVECDGASMGLYDENLTDEEAAKRYEELPWTEAIVVYIELP